jgi:hypothetical protein
VVGEESLARPPISLHADQRLEDAIQAARYVPMVAILGTTVILEVSFSKELGDENQTKLAEVIQIRTHETEFHDLSDTAALLSELDLFIVVDASVAHRREPSAKRYGFCCLVFRIIGG